MTTTADDDSDEEERQRQARWRAVAQSMPPMSAEDIALVAAVLRRIDQHRQAEGSAETNDSE